MRKETLKESYDSLCRSVYELEKARLILSKVLSKAEESESIDFVLENVGKFAPPSDDAHEVLFARSEKAKSELNDFYTDGTMLILKDAVLSSKSAIDKTWDITKSL